MTPRKRRWEGTPSWRGRKVEMEMRLFARPLPCYHLPAVAPVVGFRVQGSGARI